MTQLNKLEILAEHCQRIGRNPATVRKMIHFGAILHQDEQTIRRQADRDLLVKFTPSLLD